MFGAVFLPSFPVQAVLRWREEGWTRAVVVADPASGLVAGRTLPAAARGISEGMRVPQAMARCPELEVVSRSERQEKMVAGLLAEVALRFSPFVEHTAPGLVTLDFRGTPLRMGWHDLGDALVGQLRNLGLRACVAFGKNPDVARLASREADPVSVVRDTGAFLHPLPLDVLSPPPEVMEILNAWGVRTVGEFLALPAQDAIERLGPEARTMWQVAMGRSRRPLRLVREPEVFEESCDLGYAVETTEPLLFLLRKFVDRLAERLRALYLVAGRMTLVLPLEGRTVYERGFSIPEPTAVADVLFRILVTHLEMLKLEEKPVGASLIIEPAAPSRQQFGLFGAALRDPNRFGETLARIAAIVGTDGVGFAEPADTHRPDAFRLTERVSWSLEETPIVVREPVPLGLPLRRCRPPVAARVVVAGRCPSRISSTLANGRIASVLGPYRLSGHWWESGAWQIEEWDIALAGGGLYRIARSSGAWRIEGIYDAVC